jgi:anti-anti-sigma factor
MLLQIAEKNIAEGVTALVLTGRITLGRSCQELEWELDRLRASNGRVILDVSGIERIDSAGIGILALSAGKMKEAGGELCVAGAQGMVADTVKLTKMDTILRFFPNLEAATQA